MNPSTFRSMKKLLGAILFAALLTACPNQALNDSKTALAAGNKANGAKQFESAIAEYQKAVDRYHDNHLAWYGMGGAYAGKASGFGCASSRSCRWHLPPRSSLAELRCRGARRCSRSPPPRCSSPVRRGG
jgi:tetratricopeptide (TPR) repeat protein